MSSSAGRPAAGAEAHAAATPSESESHSHSGSSSGHLNNSNDGKHSNSSLSDRFFFRTSARSQTRTSSSPSVTTLVVAKSDHSKLGTTVRQVLDNPAIAKRFRDYAASLHADEGLLFLDDLQKMHSHSDQRTAADTLMHKYFMDDAECQVNLPDGIRSDLFEKFQCSKFASVEQLFDDATFEVFTDIKKSDTFRNFLLIDEEARRICNDDALILDRWLITDNFRSALAACGEDATLANILRFCTSVFEFEQEDDKTAKKARGNKICATFVQVGSTFQIALPKMYTEAILNGKFQVLPDARIECIQVLAKNAAVMDACRKGLTEIPEPRAMSNGLIVGSHTVELQQILKQGAGRALVQRLVEDHVDTLDRNILNKARFCTAVANFLSMPGSVEGNSEKLGAARKIVATYVQVGSQFQVDLSAGFVEDLCKPKCPNYTSILSIIYQQFVSDLGGSTLITDSLSKVHV